MIRIVKDYRKAQATFDTNNNQYGVVTKGFNNNEAVQCHNKQTAIFEAEIIEGLRDYKGRTIQ